MIQNKLKLKVYLSVYEPDAVVSKLSPNRQMDIPLEYVVYIFALFLPQIRLTSLVSGWIQQSHDNRSHPNVNTKNHNNSENE